MIRLVNNLTAYIIVRMWPGGKRENIAIILKEENARKFAAEQIKFDGSFIHMETCQIVGQFTSEHVDVKI